MPSFEYECKNCEYIFEELLIQSDEIQKYSKSCPCPSCGKDSLRVVSAANFTFKVSTPGNSGVHDVDYPTLDKAVGRSAAKKWQKYNDRKTQRDKFRKEHGVVAITEHNDKIIPTSPQKLELRQKALKKFSEIQKSNK